MDVVLQRIMDTIRMLEDEISNYHDERLEKYYQTQKDRFLRLTRLIESTHEGGRIVEAGAEPFLLQYLLDRTLDDDVIGLDLNPSRYNRFISKNNLTVFRCDLASNTYPVDRASFVILSEVLEHLIDPIGVLDKIYDLLQEGGKLLLTTPNFYRLETLYRFFTGQGFNDAVEAWKKMSLIGHPGHIRLYTSDEVQRLLTESGFRLSKSTFERFGASKRGIPAGPILSASYRAVPTIRPYQMHIAHKPAKN
jgi:SAM-dependent methyltransferase